MRAALLLCTPVLAQEVTAYPPPARTVPNQALEIAIAPYVSAGVTAFLTQELANESSFSNIHDPRTNVWVAVGVQGRFDLFSSGGSETRLASN